MNPVSRRRFLRISIITASGVGLSCIGIRDGLGSGYQAPPATCQVNNGSNVCLVLNQCIIIPNVCAGVDGNKCLVNNTCAGGNPNACHSTNICRGQNGCASKNWCPGPGTNVCEPQMANTCAPVSANQVWD